MTIRIPIFTPIFLLLLVKIFLFPAMSWWIVFSPLFLVFLVLSPIVMVFVAAIFASLVAGFLYFFVWVISLWEKLSGSRKRRIARQKLLDKRNQKK